MPCHCNLPIHLAHANLDSFAIVRYTLATHFRERVMGKACGLIIFTAALSFLLVPTPTRAQGLGAPGSDLPPGHPTDLAGIVKDIKASIARHRANPNAAGEADYDVRMTNNFGMLQSMGNPALPALAELVNDRTEGTRAAYTLGRMLGVVSDNGVTMAPSVALAEIDQPTVTALGRAVPKLKTIATTDAGDSYIGSAVLMAIAPRVPAAAPAFADVVAAGFAPQGREIETAALLVKGNPGLRRKVEAAAPRGNARVKIIVDDMALLTRLARLPRPQAAAELKAMEPARQQAVLAVLPDPRGMANAIEALGAANTQANAPGGAPPVPAAAQTPEALAAALKKASPQELKQMASTIDELTLRGLANHSDRAVRFAAADVNFYLAWTQKGFDKPFTPPTHPLTPEQAALFAKLKAAKTPEEGGAIWQQLLVNGETPPWAYAEFLRMLASPEPAIYHSAVSPLLRWSEIPRMPDVLAKIILLTLDDPDIYYRQELRRGMETSGSSDDIGVRFLLRQPDEPARRAAALRVSYSDGLNIPVADLERLATDPSAAVRKPLPARFVFFRNNVDVQIRPQFEALMSELMKSPHPEIRGGALGSLFAQSVSKDLLAQLAASPDEQISLAAKAAQNAFDMPFALASKVATKSESPRARLMAGLALLKEDPADPTRQPRGTAVLLPAANVTDDALAVAVLDALVEVYCGSPTRDPEILRFRGDGVDVIAPLFTATLPGRLKAIQDCAAVEPYAFAERYRMYRTLYDDPDPRIRAQARATTLAVINKSIAARAPAPAAPAGGAAPAPGAAGAPAR